MRIVWLVLAKLDGTESLWLLFDKFWTNKHILWAGGWVKTTDRKMQCSYNAMLCFLCGSMTWVADASSRLSARVYVLWLIMMSRLWMRMLFNLNFLKACYPKKIFNLIPTRCKCSLNADLWMKVSVPGVFFKYL